MLCRQTKDKVERRGHGAALPTLNWDNIRVSLRLPAAEGSAETVPSLSGSKWLLVHLFCCAVTIKACLRSAVLSPHSCCRGLQEAAGGLSPLLRAEDPPAHLVVPEPAATVRSDPLPCLCLHPLNRCHLLLYLLLPDLLSVLGELLGA